MSYLGSSATPIPVAFSGVRTQSLSGTGLVSLFTLSRQVNAVTDIEVIVNNVQQSPFDGSYSIVNNGLGLQFSENPSAGTNNIYVVYRDQPLGSLYDTGAVRKAGDTMTGNLVAPLVEVNAQNYPQIALKSGVGGVRNWLAFVDAAAGGLGAGSLNLRDDTAGLNRLVIDTAGRVTMPYQPAFASNCGNWTSATRRWHNGNVPLNRGGHYDQSNGRFTAPVAGAYQFICTVQGHSPGSTAGRNADYYHIIPHVNGSNAISGTEIVATCQESTGGKHDQITCNVIVALNAGDYVTMESNYGFRPGTQSVYSGHLIG